MKVSVLSLNEPQTRYLIIDPGLQAAGWNLGDRTQVRFEVPVDGYDAEPWNGVTDYCLYDTLWRRASGHRGQVHLAQPARRQRAASLLRHRDAKRQTFRFPTSGCGRVRPRTREAVTSGHIRQG
jgi:hypothetical protein